MNLYKILLALLILSLLAACSSDKETMCTLLYHFLYPFIKWQ